jgi:hypothetical protein
MAMNIMVNELWKQFPNLKPTSYTHWMANQTITKLVRLVEDLKIQIHGIPYTTTFTVMKNNVLDFNYSMLLGRPWLHNAHVTHDWGNNIITIEGNGTMQTISITKHLDSNTKRPEVLLCYDLMKSVMDKKEEIFFIEKPDLFTIGIITLPKPKILNVAFFGAEVGTKDLMSKFSHFEGQIQVDATLACIRFQDLDIAC